MSVIFANAKKKKKKKKKKKITEFKRAEQYEDRNGGWL